MDDGTDRAEIWQRLAALPRNQRAGIVLRWVAAGTLGFPLADGFLGERPTLSDD